MKMALYARVSTDEQLKGYSIGVQTEKLIQYVELHDIKDYEVFTDEGYSAKNLNRPAIKDVMRRLKKGEFQGIIVHKLDRLTRRVRDLQDIVDFIDSNHLQLISLNENLDSKTANGRFHLNILGSAAQWEREAIQERVCLGVKQAALSGKIVGTVPFGYSYDSLTGTVSVNEDEAEVVKIVFNMYAKGYGSNAISKYIYETYPKDFMNFGNTQILRMIKRRSYIGEYRTKFKDGTSHTVSDAYPAIIDLDLFNRVQDMIEKRKITSPRERSARRIFTGYLTCAFCGHSICGSASGSSAKPGTLSYRCSQKYTRTKCQCANFVEDEIEKMFVDRIEATLKQINLGTIDFNINYSKANDKDKLQKELSQIASKRKKCYLAFENDLITLDEFKTRSDEFKQREETIIKEIEDLKEISVPKIFEFTCEDFSTYWYSMDRFDKIEFMSQFIKTIKVSKTSYLTTGRREPLVIHDITFI